MVSRIGDGKFLDGSMRYNTIIPVIAKRQDTTRRSVIVVYKKKIKALENYVTLIMIKTIYKKDFYTKEEKNFIDTIKLPIISYSI